MVAPRASRTLSHLHFLALPHSTSDNCIALAMGLQSGPCSSQAALLDTAADTANQTCESLAAGPAPGPDCCAQIAAFASASCACDASTLAMAGMMGVSEAQIKGVLRGASATCKAEGPVVSGPCFEACA